LPAARYFPSGRCRGAVQRGRPGRPTAQKIIQLTGPSSSTRAAGAGPGFFSPPSAPTRLEKKTPRGGTFTAPGAGKKPFGAFTGGGKTRVFWWSQAVPGTGTAGFELPQVTLCPGTGGRVDPIPGKQNSSAGVGTRPRENPIGLCHGPRVVKRGRGMIQATIRFRENHKLEVIEVVFWPKR